MEICRKLYRQMTSEHEVIGYHDKFDIIFLFMAGGLIGTVYESILSLLQFGYIQDRSGSILTPFNYVYGCGAVVIFLVLHKVKKTGAVFLIGCILGGVVEYVLSVFQEQVFGSTSWDYSSRALNIHGRTTIPFMIIWGILCLVSMMFIFPLIIKGLHKSTDGTRKKIAIVIFTIICFDAIITATAVIRYTQRADGLFFDNFILQCVDNVFTDVFMKLHFPNMVIH